MGKFFEKQTKTIKDQGEKQVKAIQDNEKQPANINEDYKNTLMVSKEREIFKNINNERLDKLNKLNKEVDYDNLKFVVERSGAESDITALKGPLALLNDIRTGEMKLEETKNLQKDYDAYLRKIRKGNKTQNKKEL